MIAKTMRQVIEVSAVLPAHLLTGFNGCFAERRPVAVLRGEEWTALGMDVVGGTVPILCLAKIREGPGGIPAPVTHLRPMIVVLRLRADVDHAVDGA